MSSSNPIISIKHLNKYYGAKQILHNINLDIEAGQVLGYIGPNGAGKSTTVKILTGLISDFEGDVLIKRKSIKEHPVEIKRMIGFVPELAEIYDVLTPYEYLMFIGCMHNLDAEVCESRMNKMLSAFGLQEVIHQRMDSFSKGMKQKVLLTSGLIHNPEIIILDEPLSGLDANSVIIVKDLISKLAKEGKTIFYCSHMMDVVEKVSNRIILIDKGTIMADGSFASLKQQLGEQSLENMFAQITAGDSLQQAADNLLSAFEN